jgi:hypothetical protein
VRRPSALTLAGAVVSVAVLAGVVWWAVNQDAPELPSSRGQWAALAAAVALYFVACAVRGERWQVLLVENGAAPRRVDTYGLIAVGYMGNNVLPARAGDIFRAVLLPPRARTDARTVIGTLVAERLCDVLVLFALFGLLAYGVLSGGAAGVEDRVGLLAAIGGAALVVALLAAFVLHRTGRLGRVADFVRPLVAATRNLRGRHGAVVIALTVVTWALEGVVWYLAAVAADLGVDLVEALYLLALASVIVLVPAGPGYAGTLDAAIIIGADALDVASSGALTYVILLRFVLMVPITLAGAAIGFGRYGGGLLAARRSPARS